MSHSDPRWCARLSRGTEAAREGPQPPSRAVDRADFDPAYDDSAPIICEVCGFRMRYTASCKITCGNCGYKRDCSDP